MKIVVGVYENQKIVQEGLCALLSTHEDIEGVAIFSETSVALREELKEKSVNVLLMHLKSGSIEEINLIKQSIFASPKTSILLFSATMDEKLILKMIKAGIKGFLNMEADSNELYKAILTIRAGYDYYSDTITHLLLGKYLKTIKGKDMLEEPGIEALSSRQIEIIRMWGNNMSNKEIADRLFISVRTVESHKNHIMQRLNLKNTIDMIKFGIKNNLIEI